MDQDSHTRPQHEEAELAILTPHNRPNHFPAPQLAGYAASLALTLAAFGLTWQRWLSPGGLVATILVLAFVQAALQLGIFMHLREGRGTLWHLPVLALALTVGLGIVGLSIWIMLFKSGVS